MSPELDVYLTRKYPNLYRQRNGTIMETAMCWGFECGDGWFNLIQVASAAIEELILEMPESSRELYNASQVKEKYGSLRFYMDSETDKMSKIISLAEKQSAITCENCGKPGKISGKDWYSCRCKECK